MGIKLFACVRIIQDGCKYQVCIPFLESSVAENEIDERFEIEPKQWSCGM